MKLRTRSVETKETIRVEIADSSSLLDLKTLIAGNLSSSSTPISPQSIALSLNRREELISSSPADSLRSLGITSGDLIFYSQTLNLFTSPVQTPNSVTGNESNPVPTSASVPVMDVETAKEAPLVEKAAAEAPNPVPNSKIPNPEVVGDYNETLVSEPRQQEEVDMEIETPSVEKSPSVPCFLKRVMDLENEEIKGNLGFLVVGIHAVFLESGFVPCNGDGSHLPKDWSLATTAISIRYTIPELLGQIQEKDVKHVALKFSVMRNHVSVYGSLSGEPKVYRLYLDLSKVVPLLVFLSDRVSEEEEEKEVFKFWKTVKDRLCLPLLIDICQKNGLPPPPSFVRLPTDLKIKLLELLPAVDVAYIGCTSSEMRYLTSNDELWRQKFMEEFGRADESEVAAVSSWKEKFKRRWVKRRDVAKTLRELLENRHVYQRRFMPRYPPFAPQRFPQRFPFFVGDFDRFPVIGNFGPIGPGLGCPRRNFSPHCNPGGHNDDFMG